MAFEGATETRDCRDNIILIGMPGVGKSSTGVVLAKMLGYDFIDVDIVIQKRCRCTLQEIIDTRGVDEFIAEEGSALLGLSCERTVISTGGSAVYSYEAMEKLAESNIVIHLDVSLDELARRLPGFTDRGVVMRDPSIDSLEGLYMERDPLYRHYAHECVDTDGLSVADVAQELFRIVSAG